MAVAWKGEAIEEIIQTSKGNHNVKHFIRNSSRHDVLRNSRLNCLGKGVHVVNAISRDNGDARRNPVRIY